MKPVWLLLLKPGARLISGNPLTAIKLTPTASDLLMDGVLTFPKQVFFVMEHLDRPFDKFLDAPVSAAFEVLLDNRSSSGFRLMVIGSRFAMLAGVNFIMVEMTRCGTFSCYSDSMGAKTGLSVEEYLHTSFPDLDREYRDGELVERSLPDYLHGKTQLLLAAFFAALRKRLSIFPCTETRMKIRTRRYVIPDLAVFWPQEPTGIPETPPLVAIEILSRDDRLAEVRDKLEEYKTWGVAHVWLVDPHSRRMYTCETGLLETQSLKISELGVEVTGADIFD